MDKIIKVFSCCFWTRGHNRSLIVDIQRKKYFPVPNTLIDFLEKAEGCNIDKSMNDYSSDDEDLLILKEYIDFLIANEIIFLCNSGEEYRNFPPMNLDWHYPAHLANAVMEVSTPEDVKKINKFQGSFFIPFAQFIIRSAIEHLSELEQFIQLMLLRNAKGIQLVFDNAIGFSEHELVALCNRYPLIESLYAFNSTDNKTLRSLKTFLIMTTQTDFSNICCGTISQKYFNPLLSHYTEAQRYNTCLNRKIAIDINGNIRNCLSMQESYGNIETVAISEIAFNPSFQKYWGLKKDDISVCKDCEFRYVCTDCRAYIEDPADIRSKPLKCGYNPYNNEWEEWSTHPMKQAAIAFYKMEPLIKT